MASSQPQLSTGSKLGGFKNPDVTTTPDINVRVGPCEVRSLDLIEGDAETVYYKLYDNTGGDGLSEDPLAVGTTPPSHGFLAKASGTVSYEFYPPLRFAYGLSVVGSTEDGNAVTTSPADLSADLATVP
jgi:hypothetical protein